METIEGKLTRNCFSFTRGREATVLCMRGSGGERKEREGKKKKKGGRGVSA